MAKKSSINVPIISLVGFVLAGLTAGMMALDIFITESALRINTNLFDLLSAMFNGDSMTTTETFATIFLGLAFLLCIVCALLYLVGIFVKNKKQIYKLAKLVALSLVALVILGFIFVVIVVQSYNADALFSTMSIGLGAILSLISSILLIACVLFFKK